MHSATQFASDTLPARRTPIVGRAAELASLAELLLTNGVRLVTLTGPGGVGKTRLAIETAHAIAEDGRLDVVFAPLSAANGAEAVVVELARALDFSLPPAATVDALVNHLRDREFVLVIDNFEHVIEEAPLITRLLDHAPGLRMLVTSRAPLRVSGEQEFPLDPLPVPGDDGAVALFVQRAAAVRPGFALTDDNRAVLIEICRRLDGLPLAIELAAARLRLLSPEALLSRLDRRLALLSTGQRDAPERQQTLRGAIAWSYELLASEEQRLFWLLGIFAGSFTLDDAERVIARAFGTTDGAQPPIDVLGGVFSLVDQSLLRRVDQSGTTPRVSMLETIREFALERLSGSADWQPLRSAFAQHYCDQMRRANDAAKTAGAPRWLEWLDWEVQNLRAAAELTLDLGDRAAALRLIGSFANYWTGRFALAELHGWIERAWQLPGDLSPGDRFEGEFASAWIDNLRGAHEQARERARNAVDAAGESGDPRHAVRAHNLLGGLAFHLGDAGEAGRQFSEGIRLAEAYDLSIAVHGMLHNLGLVQIVLDDLDAACRTLERGRTAAEAKGDTLGAALCDLRLGQIAVHLGDLPRAARLGRSALAAFHAGHHDVGAVEAIGLEAMIAERQGQQERARRLAAVAVEAIGDPGVVDPKISHRCLDAFEDLRRRLGIPESTRRGAGRGDVPAALVNEILRSPLPEPGATTQQPQQAGDALGLTPREVEIVRLMAKGLSNQEIADELYISLRTAQTHVSNILGKLKVSSRAAVAAVAVRHGLD